MNVAILGCGPAGLIAAAAATHEGGEVTIFSKKRKSQMFGAQYLHAPIPAYTDTSPVDVSYELFGDTNSYRVKVYGATWDGQVSPEDYMGEHKGWDIRRTYDNLWHDFQYYIANREIDPGQLSGLVECGDFDLIISSIPRESLCFGDHTFQAQTVWAAGDAPERGTFVDVDIPGNTVQCSGRPFDLWYRRSNVFGYRTIEWPDLWPQRPSFIKPDATRVRKPLGHDCDCWPNVVFVGRYGKWQKDVLSHTAYTDAQDAMKELVGQ